MTSTPAPTLDPAAAPDGSSVRAVAREAQVRLAAAAVGEDELTRLTNAERVDLLRELEDLVGSAAAVQARLAADLDVAVRAERAVAGVPAERRGAGVAAQVALARRVSPARGSQYLGMGKALARELPHTMAALAAGELSEWRAMLLVRESTCLTLEDRGAFDAQLCADPARFTGWGDKRFIAEARALTARLDQAALVRRAAKAEADRRVTIRPAPDTMAQVTSLLPVAQGVAVYAALSRRADELRAQGDARARGQIMADTLVERVTGLSCAEGVPVHVNVVMTDRALLDGADDPADVNDYGVVPSRWARNLIVRAEQLQGKQQQERACQHNGAREGPDAAGGLGVWVRRLFTQPRSGELVAMQSRARRAPAGLAAFIRARDRTCRTPWCDASIRHTDHIVDYADGGPTEAEYLQGLCEACNYAKLAPGWSARPVERRDSSLVHTVVTRTPTGHTYASRAPVPPGPLERPESPLAPCTEADEWAELYAIEMQQAYLRERAPARTDQAIRHSVHAEHGQWSEHGVRAGRGVDAERGSDTRPAVLGRRGKRADRDDRDDRDDRAA
ncbi:HNH endonuclease [Ruania halotolerans]|uniref:HNH endonuclease n=1 Tax=Ruania halotolerans TaxID=2897773 RepID=UPI001E3E76CF|nr:HNH endonuclease signature motif containing protein [Ruania halotolerans]UFU05672.1 HNH endonuclease [Ruania halotolerans]